MERSYIVNVVVVGAGTMGTVHARAYERMEGVRLIGIVDSVQGRAQKLADHCNTRSYVDLDDLLVKEEVDVVDVCVPTDLHRFYAEKSFSAGKHVICEKPISRTIVDSISMIEGSKSAGVQLHVGHVLRFFPEYRAAREVVISGELGVVGTALAVRGGQYPSGHDDWYTDVDRSGSLILDMMIHDFDFLRWCFGDVKRVYAKSLLENAIQRIDHAFVTLRFESGLIAHVTGTWAYPTGFHTSLELAGKDGMLVHDSAKENPMNFIERNSSTGEVGVVVPESPSLKDPYFAELEHFIACIKGEEQPIMTVQDALAALEISLAALESVQTGRMISLHTG